MKDDGTRDGRGRGLREWHSDEALAKYWSVDGVDLCKITKDEQPRPVRTLADMSAAERRALEKLYEARICGTAEIAARRKAVP